MRTEEPFTNARLYMESPFHETSTLGYRRRVRWTVQVTKLEEKAQDTERVADRRTDHVRVATPNRGGLCRMDWDGTFGLRTLRWSGMGATGEALRVHNEPRGVGSKTGTKTKSPSRGIQTEMLVRHP